MSVAEVASIRNVVCQKCSAFMGCQSIEQQFAAELQVNGGNYRDIRNVKGERVASPVRRCVQTIFAEHIEDFKGKDVLEIGCGPLSSFNRKLIRELNVRYTGIEPERLSIYGISYFKSSFKIVSYVNAFIKRINYPIFFFLNFIQKIKKGPRAYYLKDYFPSAQCKPESYDVIYSSSSIEHWHEDLSGSSADESWAGNVEILEKGVKLYQSDIRECYEVLKKNGKLIMDCPIHVHGNGIFYHGQIEMIKKIFESAPWKSLSYEFWRKDHTGLAPYMPVERKRVWLDRWGVDVSNMWILNVVAEK